VKGIVMNNQQQNRSDEVNLYEIWKILRKRIKLISGILITIALSAAVINMLMPKVYRGEAILRIPTLEITASKISPNELIEYLGNIDSDKRAQVLPKTAHAVTDIKLLPLKDASDKIKVIIDANNKNVIQDGLNEIIVYINNIDSMKSSLHEEQESLMRRSSELAAAINVSYEIVSAYNKLTNGGKINHGCINPLDLQDRIADYHKEKILIDQNIKRIKGGVDIAKQLYIRQGPIKPRIAVNVALSGAIGLLLGIIVALIRELKV
jgi:hypothetical protein